MSGDLQTTDTEPRSQQWPAWSWRDAWCAALLGVLVVAIYGRCLTWQQPKQGFALDNQFILLEDPRLRETNWENIRSIFTRDYWWPKAVSGLYRPLTTLSYLFNYSTLGNGDRAAGYLAVNLALHWFNAGLVYALALLLLSERRRALLIAAVFAAHPIATESVANIVGRADLLATASVLGGLLLYARSASSRDHCRVWLGATVLAAVLGFLCKESAVIVLGVMALYDFTYRLRPLHASPWKNMALNFWRFAMDGYVALFVPLLALWLTRHRVHAGLRPMEFPFVDNPLVGAGFLEWQLTAIKVIGKYGRLLLWPSALSCDYSYNQIPIVQWPWRGWEDWQALVALGAIAVVLAVAVRSHRRNKAVFFLVLFSMLAILPSANILFRTGSIMAERFLYMPSVGFAGCLVLGLFAIGRRPVAQFVVVAAMVALAARAMVRTMDWETNQRLWSRALQTCPMSFKTHKSYGYALYEADPQFKQIDRSIAEAEQSLAILQHPPLPDIQTPSVVPYQLGVYYRIKGDKLAAKLPGDVPIPTALSLPWYQKSVEALLLASRYDRAYNRLNHLKESARGRRPEQIADEGLADIYAQLGETYIRLSQYTNALEAWQYWQRLNPGDPAPYLNMATAHLRLDQMDAASVRYIQAILLDASCDVAWSTLTEIYRKTGRADCVMSVVNGRPRLNAACPSVRDHLCSAYHGLIAGFLEAKQFAAARKLRDSAVSEARCPREPLDQMLSEAQVSERSSP